MFCHHHKASSPSQPSESLINPLPVSASRSAPPITTASNLMEIYCVYDSGYDSHDQHEAFYVCQNRDIACDRMLHMLLDKMTDEEDYDHLVEEIRWQWMRLREDKYIPNQAVTAKDRKFSTMHQWLVEGVNAIEYGTESERIYIVKYQLNDPKPLIVN